MLTVPMPDVLWFVDRALDEMVAIVVDLGDDFANTRPDLPGANSPYAILTHCLGVMGYWGGRMIAGRPIVRDRPAEFTATGRVADLAERAAEARRQLDADLAAFEPLAEPANPPVAEVAELPYGRLQGAVLLHIYEELAQHLGQMELTRDILRGARFVGEARADQRATTVRRIHDPRDSV